MSMGSHKHANSLDYMNTKYLLRMQKPHANYVNLSVEGRIDQAICRDKVAHS